MWVMSVAVKYWCIMSHEWRQPALCHDTITHVCLPHFWGHIYQTCFWSYFKTSLQNYPFTSRPCEINSLNKSNKEINPDCTLVQIWHFFFSLGEPVTAPLGWLLFCFWIVLTNSCLMIQLIMICEMTWNDIRIIVTTFCELHVYMNSMFFLVNC